MFSRFVGMMLIGCVGLPVRPSEQTGRLTFVEELRFGGDISQREDSYWSGLYPKVSAGPDGKMYVADAGTNRVLCYDAEGGFVRLIGGEGNGPGEFRKLINFWVLQDGSGLALDAPNDTGRFLVFDADMEYVRLEEPPNGAVRRAHASPDGRWLWVNHLGPFGPEFDVTFGVMNREFELVTRLVAVPMTPFQSNRLNDPKYLRQRMGEIMALELGRRGLAAFGHRGEVVTAVSDRYELTRWEPDLSKVSIEIQRKHKPRLRTEAEIEATIDEYLEIFKTEIPPLRDFITRQMVEDGYELSGIKPVANPLIALLMTEDGLTLAVTEVRGDGLQRADVFDVQGRLAAITQVPHSGFVDGEFIPNMVFRNDRAYSMQTVDGDFQVVRYRYSVD